MTDNLEQFIKENGGNEHDALIAAFAYVHLYNAMRMESRIKDGESLLAWVYRTRVDYDALAYQLRERDEFCQSQGPVNCPLKLHSREGMGSL